MSEKLKATIGENDMADLEDLGYESIADMNTDEAIELLRQIRLNRRTPTKKSKPSSTKTKKQSTSNVNADQAAELLKLLGGK